ncbi:hypothetical protein B0H12DRAFT_1081071 [Mycena haematopus]|nr:hypothetical protein B0H12DRAFT_1081071 [Mycena haematopus]
MSWCMRIEQGGILKVGTFQIAAIGSEKHFTQIEVEVEPHALFSDRWHPARYIQLRHRYRRSRVMGQVFRRGGCQKKSTQSSLIRTRGVEPLQPHNYIIDREPNYPSRRCTAHHVRAIPIVAKSNKLAVLSGVKEEKSQKDVEVERYGVRDNISTTFILGSSHLFNC